MVGQSSRLLGGCRSSSSWPVVFGSCGSCGSHGNRSEPRLSSWLAFFLGHSGSPCRQQPSSQGTTGPSVGQRPLLSRVPGSPLGVVNDERPPNRRSCESRSG